MSLARGILFCTVSIAALTAPELAGAQSAGTDAQINRLQQQIQHLQDELRMVQKKVRETHARVASDPVAKEKESSPKLVMRRNRPTFVSADGRNSISLTSRLDLDVGGYRYTADSPATVPQNLFSGFNARRARIGVLGTFMNDWDYTLIYDFGGSSDGFGPGVPGGATSGILNAMVAYKAFKPFTIEGGYMNVPYGHDRAISSSEIMFMERASPEVVAQNIAAGNARAAFGVRGNTDRFWAGVYLTGPTAGVAHNVPKQMGGTARVAAQLINEKDYSFMVGADALYLWQPPTNAAGLGTVTLSDRPELRIDPTVVATTGAIAGVEDVRVYSVEAVGGLGPLYLQGSYFWYSVERTNLPTFDFSGGYVQASWILTGERRKYRPTSGAYGGITPAHPFSFDGSGWGAWEIAGRVSLVDLNDGLAPAGTACNVVTCISGGKQTVYTAGVNWYVNENMRFMFNYLHGEIDKRITGAAGTPSGATFDAVAMRTQVAF